MKIRVLWLVSSIFPPLCKQLGIAKPTSGGWLYSAAKGVMETNPNIQLGFVCPYIVNEVQHFLIEGAEYFLVPKCGRNRQTLWGGCTDANPKLLLNDT